MLYLDSETYSEVPIKNGTYVYLENAECMIVTYAFDDGPIQIWDATASPLMPNDLADYLDGDGLITMHNAMFDRNVLKYCLGYNLPVERFRCTMVRALLHGLPGGLDKLSAIFKLGTDAKKDGKKLIHLFCKPVKKEGKLVRNTRETHPAEWSEFLEYARGDIKSMRVLDTRIPKWNYTGSELAYWFLDQRRNDRGVALDVGLAKAALRAVDKEQRALKDRTHVITDGELDSTTKRDAMLIYMFEAYGVVLPDLQMATVERRLNDPDIPIELKELLQIRLQASTSSTSKYKAMLKSVNSDGRIRGMIQFAGAIRTARDAGRTVQPQNFPSRGLMDQEDIDIGVELLKADAADMVFDNVMHLTSSCLRSALIAPPGKKLVAADLSNIEGRYLAWAAGEEWKLQAFRDYDTFILDTNGNKIPLKDDYERKGHDLYILAYAKAFKIAPSTVSKQQRQIGKVLELSMGFASGVGGFLTFAVAYNVDLEELADLAYDTFPVDVREESEGFYKWTVKQRRSTFGLSERAFVTCETFKRLWRKAHPMIEALWYGLEDGARNAITAPGTTFTYGRFKMRRDGQWLRLVMPSGRALCYPYPQVDDRGGISFMGMNQYTRKWERIKTYGGKLAENCIAVDTPVLTDKGWVAIQAVTSEHKVWDGVDFVTNNGCVFKGNQVVLSTYGVLTTPDHRILTDDGWKDAQSCQGHNRYVCRLPDGYQEPWLEWQTDSLGATVPLWQDRFAASQRADQMEKTRGATVVRMYAQGDHFSAQDDTRYESAPCIRGVAKHGRPLSSAYASGVAQLWRQGYSSLQRMAIVVRELLAGYGAYVPSGAYYRAHGQYGALHQRELSVENYDAPSEQQTEQHQVRYTSGETDGSTSGRPLRRQTDDVPLSNTERVALAEGVKPVYDIVNCGPRQRFVVKGTNGEIVVVHNCTQAGARDVFKHGELHADRAGYDVIFPVHDELVTEVPDTPEYSAEGLAEVMSIVPPWATGLPLAAAGFETKRYRK